MFDCDLSTRFNTVVNGETIVYAFSKLFLNSNSAVNWFMSDFENDMYYKSYNLQLIEEFIYNIYFITSEQSVCSFSSDFVFTTYIPRNVFAISSMTININTIDRNRNIGVHRAIF